MMETPGFVERFAAVAENFKWQFLGKIVCSYKGGRFFDPITALVWISRQHYCDRHELHIAKAMLGLSDESYSFLMKVLYNPNYGDRNCSQIRNLIEEACGLLQVEEAS